MNYFVFPGASYAILTGLKKGLDPTSPLENPGLMRGETIMRPLITQFDSEKSRKKTSVVMYEACSCCCCCSCVVTTLGSSILLARRLGLALQEQKAQGSLNIEDQPDRKRVRLAKLLGFFILPLCVLCLVLGLFYASLLGPHGFLILPTISSVLYALGLLFLHFQFGLPMRYALQYFFLTILLFTGEFFLWLNIL